MILRRLVLWGALVSAGAGSYALTDHAFSASERYHVEQADGHFMLEDSKTGNRQAFNEDLYFEDPYHVLHNMAYQLAQRQSDSTYLDSLVALDLASPFKDQLNDCFKTKIDSTIDLVARKLKQGLDIIL